MKKSTQRIIEKFPFFEEMLMEKGEETLKSLDQFQDTFFKLANFFENPETVNFNLADLYKTLNDSWLEWALELITQFFRDETYLIKTPSFSIIKDGADFLNQSQFANFLTQKGLNYSRHKVNLYLERGKIPKPDLLVGGTKYWSKALVEQYCELEKRKKN